MKIELTLQELEALVGRRIQTDATKALHEAEMIHVYDEDNQTKPREMTIPEYREYCEKLRMRIRRIKIILSRSIEYSDMISDIKRLFEGETDEVR